MGHIEELRSPQVLQNEKNEERDSSSRAYDRAMERRGTRVPNWNATSHHRVGRCILPDWPLKRGAPIVLSGQRALPAPVDEYLANHCVPGVRLVGGRITIKDIRDLPLRSILFSIMSIVGSTRSHLVSRSQVAYGLQCLEPTLFNWSAGFLQNVKEKITRCRAGKQKQFGYGSFLVSFFLEHIPQMQPQIALAVRPVGEPRMERWTSLSPRLGSDSEFKFTGDFFAWLRRQLIMIEDFPYARVDFREAWTWSFHMGWTGMRQVRNQKISCQVFFFFFKTYIIFFGYIEEFLTDVSFHHADKGETHLAEIPTLGHRGDAQVVVVVGGLQEVETNLRGLTTGIPPLERENVPLHLQRHTVGVPESINSLLR
jgi:hypothetical protein